MPGRADGRAIQALRVDAGRSITCALFLPDGQLIAEGRLSASNDDNSAMAFCALWSNPKTDPIGPHRCCDHIA